MIPWVELGRAQAPGGGELVLRQRGEELEIRVAGHDLMSSRMHGSEDALARLGCAHVGPAPRVLVGGLGMGFTLRAALEVLPADAQVVVAELVPAVVEWNRGPLAHLARRPLEDPRVTVQVGEVGKLLAASTLRYDAILLDVDNGPVALTRRGNQLLYSPPGLELMRRTLRPGGVLAVWSAARSPDFEQRMRKAGFAARSELARARGAAGGAAHVIFVGQLAAR
jgi:spermidine synthase